MDKNKKFNSYNQIIKEFDVYIMQVSKQTYQFKLVKRLDGDNPPRAPKYFTDFVSKQEEFNKKVLDFIEKQTKFNEFILDQFKAHGWIK